MKLPVRQILSKNRKHYQIIDSNNKIIIPDIPELSDAILIEDSLNNYDESVELLKQIKMELINEGIISGQLYDIFNKIDNFLNKYKYENS